MNYTKPVKRVLDRLRKMNYWQRIVVMDWLNGWYADVKEQEQLEQEQMHADKRDDCICREDHIDSGCPECF